MLPGATEPFHRLRPCRTQEQVDANCDPHSQVLIDTAIIGSSPALQAVRERVRIVASTDFTVLINGETGTGKQLFARLIHELSGRGAEPFIQANCAAIPEGLLESELFGHEKGAFTSAVADRIGRFEAAHKGTIFLDEVGEIPLSLQPKLLRVLQEREFERLGSSRTIRVDARVIAATNRNLRHLVEARQFRADLFYRLNVFPVELPALRERREDIPLLVDHFVGQVAERIGRPKPEVPASVLAPLVEHPWSGNVRELENFIQRAVILSENGVLQLPPCEAMTESPRLTKEVTGTLREVEREHILRILESTGWVVGGSTGAAAILGLPRTTLITKMAKLGIRRGIGHGASE